MVATCAAENSISVDQSSFWSSSGVNWDTHRIGWAVAGGCSVLTLIISMISVLSHARHYTCPPEQRQILRILYMPPVYAIVSFFSYRFFRSFTYYELAEVVYEAVTISAFMLLLIEYVAATASGHKADNALARKDKRSLPIPFCCWRYRPTKAYFMYTVKWAVMQYVVVRPLVSAVAIVAEKYGVLCENGGYNIHFAYAYLSAVDFVSITVALYGLFIFYGLTKEELQGRRPLAKFLCIKLIVMFTFYQAFVFGQLEHKVIKPTQYWTSTNIANGLNALTICVEMVLFSLFFMWAYPASEYKLADSGTTSIWKPLWDSINYTDFIREIFGSLKFFIDYIRCKPHTRGPSIPTSTSPNARTNFEDAFGLSGSSPYATAKARGYSRSSSVRGGGVGGKGERIGSLDEEAVPLPIYDRHARHDGEGYGDVRPSMAER
ncbi:DUF300-domain-containing protein [Rickenella mellea]|uniref:DUF300-domain-containing protein n=1 Tax=Rickenella mellea TaxID=50990 RepID=A0A4Y7PT58_9AGAM|nr:DUF300-domain-containing protein [Rickenella mellea]